METEALPTIKIIIQSRKTITVLCVIYLFLLLRLQLCMYVTYVYTYLSIYLSTCLSKYIYTPNGVDVAFIVISQRCYYTNNRYAATISTIHSRIQRRRCNSHSRLRYLRPVDYINWLRVHINSSLSLLAFYFLYFTRALRSYLVFHQRLKLTLDESKSGIASLLLLFLLWLHII